MTTEYEKMLAGELYQATDPEIGQLLAEAADRMMAFNRLSPVDFPSILDATANIAAPSSHPAFVKPPFYFEFGRHIQFGEQVFVNMGCTFLDSGPIRIGDFVAMGPNCQLITATHHTTFEERLVPAADGPLKRIPMAYTRPIEIGSHCWLGAGVIVMPGVTIGEGSVIGAGSVVTKDIPAGMVALGNPARVVRPVGS